MYWSLEGGNAFGSGYSFPLDGFLINISFYSFTVLASAGPGCFIHTLGTEPDCGDHRLKSGLSLRAPTTYETAQPSAAGR